MEEKELLKALNGIKFDEEEIEECLNYDGISIDELKFKSSNLRTKISIDYFEEQKQLVKSMLEKDETMRTYIKGANIEMLRMSTLLSASSPVGLLKTNDIGYNYSIFITQKRIFICDVNYYNSKVTDFKIYPIEEIEDISFNKIGYTPPKDVRKSWGGIMHPSTLTNTWLWYFYAAGLVAAFAGVQAMVFKLFGLLNLFGGEVSEEVVFLDFSSNAGLPSFIFTLVLFIVLILLFRHFTRFKLRVSIKTKNKSYWDFIIVNSDHKFILKVLKDIRTTLKLKNKN